MDQPFPAYQGDEPYVFVCYAHDDEDVVYPEIAWLREHGINIWYDEGISAGKVWRRELAEAIQGASKLLYYISNASLQSEHCNREIEYALDKEVEVVPVYLDETELTPELDLALNRVQALHRDEDTTYQQHLLNALGHSASTQPQTVSSPVHRRLRWWHYLVGGLVLTIVIGATWLYSLYEDATTAISIAVLPFTNMSTDEETGFFARGLSESILDRLAQSGYEHPDLGKLKVASRTASFQFADRGDDLSVIAEKLDVAYVLEGSVQPMGDSLHIIAQLIRAEDNFHVWSKSYERALVDRFETQAGVVQNIAHVAESELLHDIEMRYAFWGALANGTNSVAYGYLLNSQNQFRLIRLGEGGDSALRVQLLKKAIQADPEFGYAYEMLANAYVNGAWGSMSRQEAATAAHEAISRAIELNPDSVDSFLALGEIYLFMDLDYANAKASFEPGLDRFPDHPWFHIGLARIALREGRTSEALREMATASVLDAGQYTDFPNTYGWVLLVAGDYKQALKVFTEGLNLMSAGRRRLPNLRGQIVSLINLGRIGDIKPLLAEAWDLDGRLTPEAYISAFVRIGEKERAERILADSESADQYSVALGYVALDDVDNTFKAIEAAIEDHNFQMIESLRTAEWWDGIRDDPRFDDMLELLDSKETHTEQYLKDRENRE